ncbi:hypothetical protein ABID65_007655 [Bradyrhizobium sp. S3.9.2]|uniref:hypothetical protein n=1 Tax=unclassified Bradyrhizobium TaxID=2631580 RepID=UPI0033927CAC
MVDRDQIATIQFTDFNGRARVVTKNPDGSWTYFPRDHSKWVYGCFNNNGLVMELTRTILLGGLLLVAANAADAAEMPSMFHGRWCGEPHMMKHCGKDEEGIQITARGFHYEAGNEAGCRLVGLRPQWPTTRADVEYRATFVCGGERPPNHREYYWIGFYDDDRNEGLFLLKSEKTFGRSK